MFLIVCLLGKKIGGYYTALAVCFSTFFSVLLSVDAFVFMLYSSFNLVYDVRLAPIFEFSSICASWHFYFDYLTLSIFCLISIVSFFIQIFSISYMGEDASHTRFISYLCFFIVAILLLVGAPNFVQLFFGWELVGLASFLLINFWFGRSDANISAFKAVAVNRVGDCFLLFSMFVFLYRYQVIEFDLIFSVFVNDYLTFLGFSFLVIGCFAKSAQFFFHGWLPDAMEGPTPVSALLHSATMVTAGVFLALRFMEIMAVFSVIRYIVVFFGLLTALYAISIASVADDTKRVTAYTTLNQLGFMFFGCGSLAGATVLFHLIVHGFYKSFSFLSAAIELYDLEDEQDGEYDNLDIVQGFNPYDLFTSLVFLSVNAIPFTSPSISKEFLLLSGMENVTEYMTFLVCIVLFSSPVDEGRDDIEDAYEVAGYQDELYVSSAYPYPILFGCFGLGILSIFSATFLEEVFIDMNYYWCNASVWNWLDVKGSILIFLPFVALVVSEFDSSKINRYQDFSHSTVITRLNSSYQTLLFNAELWFYDEILGKLSAKFISFSDRLTNFTLDKAYIEYVYVTGAQRFFQSLHWSVVNSRYSMEKVYSYSLVIVILVFSFNSLVQLPTIWFILTIFCVEYFIYNKSF